MAMVAGGGVSARGLGKRCGGAIGGLGGAKEEDEHSGRTT